MLANWQKSLLALSASPLAPNFFTAAPALLITPVTALVMPAVVVDLVMLVGGLRNELRDAIMASLVTSTTSTWALNVNNVCDKRSGLQEEGTFTGIIALEIVAKVGSSYDTYASGGNERRDPVNALSQLLASLFAAPHLPELERP